MQHLFQRNCHRALAGTRQAREPDRCTLLAEQLVAVGAGYFTFVPSDVGCFLFSHRCSGSLLRGARSEEHTSEPQSLMRISYAGFCLKKTSDYKNTNKLVTTNTNDQSAI